MIIAHEHSKTYSCFLKHGGLISCEVTGKYKHLAVAGRLKIICLLPCTGQPKIDSMFEKTTLIRLGMLIITCLVFMGSV